MKYIVCFLMIILTLYSCNNNADKNGHSDSSHAVESSLTYTCPMHPEVISDKPGKCPKCGMELEQKAHTHEAEIMELNALIKPTNEFVISDIPTITMQSERKDITVQALGNIAYDTRQTGNISARISGRIEKLYVRYKFQKITKGQKVMDIYSPELMEAQENLLFLLKNDAMNSMMINAAKQKLLLLGMSESQLRSIIQKGKPDFWVSVYSNYAGHIHEAGTAGSMGAVTSLSNSMEGISETSSELTLKEGMYVQKGQTIFNVFNPGKSWVLLNIFSEDVPLVKTGQTVNIVPEVAPEKKFTGTIGFIEPFFREGSKTLSVRIYFDNSRMQLPIGSQVKSEIETDGISGNWIPKEAVISLGLTKVVFKKVDGGFFVNKIETGNETDRYIEVLQGLLPTDAIARNAQYLMDSESFVRTKNN
ncbi:efflux RND transporter periplasmic adaptor subunit [Sphingobacterium sp.]|uniref:efflux RND transporter periplasmic adaptor subunit n=1 Tax=Sphingobacterium sp. TaxID=341027 RepID=UPI00289776DF|nr:efflux RND transporter periplasmic adaptor subunit [Sphingobacterium sp.]